MTLSKADANASRSSLRRISRAYLAQAGALSYRGLSENQDAPWASIACGAGGIATAFWRVGRSDRDSQGFEIASRWLSEATRGSRARSAFWIPTFGELDLRASLFYGEDGIHFLRALVASEEGRKGRKRSAAVERAVSSFLARCRRHRAAAPSELLHGVAGTLTALVILHRASGEPRVLRVADEVAHDLLDRADGRDAWTRSPSLGFAHGRAGTFHALLGWSLAAKRELPAKLFDHLAHHADDVKKSGTMGAPRLADGEDARHYQRTWCSGAAGQTILWARAYEHTPDATYLRHARAAARFVLAHTRGAPGGLCCGLAGRAYSLLAIDRIEPGKGWFDRALAMAARATETMLAEAGSWPNGLSTGYPGLVCLTRDLLAAPRDRVGFPLVEG